MTLADDLAIIARMLAGGQATPQEQKAASSKLAGLAAQVARMERAMDDVAASDDDAERREVVVSITTDVSMTNEELGARAHAIARGFLDCCNATERDCRDLVAAAAAGWIVGEVLENCEDKEQALSIILQTMKPTVLAHGLAQVMHPSAAGLH